MTTSGTIIKTTSGRTLKVAPPFSEGTQGYISRAKDMDTGEAVAVKIFKKDYATADNIVRTEYLCSCKLGTHSPILAAPLELINCGSISGYTMPLIEGVPLLVCIKEHNPNFIQNLVSLTILARGLATLHDLNISHGDVHGGNVLVFMMGTAMKPFFIDFDNFSAPGIPPPTCIGDEMYLAPELYRAALAGTPIPPSIGSDLYSFRIMAEEILMLRHPTAGFLESGNFEKAMYEKWMHDPALPPVKDVDGYPAGILNAHLANFMRRGMQADSLKRPSAAEWFRLLHVLIGGVHVCPNNDCRCPVLIDASKTKCPHCGQSFPALSLVLPDNRRIIIDKGSVRIGRGDLGGSMSVSGEHAILRKIGPATLIESHGQNGTWRKEAPGWVRLEDGKPVPINSGDVLRFADVVVKVEC